MSPILGQKAGSRPMKKHLTLVGKATFGNNSETVETLGDPTTPLCPEQVDGETDAEVTMSPILGQEAGSRAMKKCFTLVRKATIVSSEQFHGETGETNAEVNDEKSAGQKSGRRFFIPGPKVPEPEPCPVSSQALAELTEEANQEKNTLKNSQGSCTFCKKEIKDEKIVKCKVCHLYIHCDAECGLPDPRLFVAGLANEEERVCRNCLCSTCKEVKLKGRKHACICKICNKKVSQNDCIKCKNCSQVVHTACCSGNLCNNCSIVKACGLSPDDLKQLASNEMLTDRHLTVVTRLLKTQFPHVGGLHEPMASESDIVEPATAYSTYKGPHYVQFMNTGELHWVTLIIQKGKPNLLDSSGSKCVTSFVEQQLAQIMFCQNDEFIVNICATQTQEEGINECGPLAVAFAVEFLYTNELRHHKFIISELRPHLQSCLLNGKMTPFPKIKDSNAPMKIRAKWKVEVYCICRMPQHFSTKMVYCDKCRSWLHYKCQNLTDSPKGRQWKCSTCV